MSIFQRPTVPSPNAALQILGTDITSTRLTADGVVSALPCYLIGYVLTGDASNVGVLLLYDNASEASGTVVGEGRIASTGMASVILPSPGRWCSNGLYGDLTTCNVIVYYHR